jgi:hypothetical protein
MQSASRVRMKSRQCSSVQEFSYSCWGSSTLPHLHNQFRQQVFIGRLLSTGIWHRVGTICCLPKLETKAEVFSYISVNFRRTRCPQVGLDSVVRTATRYGLDGPGIEYRWAAEISRARPDRPWGTPRLLYNGYCLSFPGVKQPGHGVDHPPPSNAEVRERLELYF